ncbi:MAG: SGNH/GDSL hydrolase family protein [Acidisphaera sp.]|nr:SGNH/GDSL hydrolase family protein [Acidisphaera sp.]
MSRHEAAVPDARQGGAGCEEAPRGLAHLRRRCGLALVGAAILALPWSVARAEELLAGSNAANASHWVEAWGASPQQPIDPIIPTATPLTLNNQTIREVARVSAGGILLRLRLTNEYTDAQTTVGEVHVALSQANGHASGAIVPGTDRVLTFGGEKSFTLAPNAPALSDPIIFPVLPLSSLAVSIYVSNATAPTTPHSLGVQTAYIVSGDQTAAADVTTGATTTTSRYLLSGIDVYELSPGGTIVTLGDSITDGYASTVDADHRWPDFLAQRLQSSGLRNLAVADEGISGNRVLAEGIGPNVQSRFDRDVLSRPGVRYVTVLEGINDIGFPAFFPGPAPTSEQLIQAYQQLIGRAHELGLRIFGCTLTPFQGAAYYTTAGEATREAVNAWIRTSGAYDGVIDFDAATRDPSNPQRYLPAYDSGDHLHPNDAGYAAMANAINLALFILPPYPH